MVDEKSRAQRAAQYRERAKNADANAEASSNPSVQKGFHDLAQQWRLMAERSEEAPGAPPEAPTDPET